MTANTCLLILSLTELPITLIIIYISTIIMDNFSLYSIGWEGLIECRIQKCLTRKRKMQRKLGKDRLRKWWKYKEMWREKMKEFMPLMLRGRKRIRNSGV